MIHMKCYNSFSLKNKRKILECRLLQILLGALRVNKSFSVCGYILHCLASTESVSEQQAPDQTANVQAALSI